MIIYEQSSYQGKLFATFCFIFILSWSTEAQTADQLAARYTRVVAFEIRPGILGKPTFARDGRVCRMVIEKQQYRDSQNIDFDLTIPSTLADQLVDELAPPTDRGKQVSPFLSSDSFIAGGSSFIKKDYENVSVAMYGNSAPSVSGENGAKIITISWPKRACPSDAPSARVTATKPSR